MKKTLTAILTSTIITISPINTESGFFDEMKSKYHARLAKLELEEKEENKYEFLENQIDQKYNSIQKRYNSNKDRKDNYYWEFTSLPGMPPKKNKPWLGRKNNYKKIGGERNALYAVDNNTAVVGILHFKENFTGEVFRKDYVAEKYRLNRDDWKWRKVGNYHHCATDGNDRPLLKKKKSFWDAFR